MARSRTAFVRVSSALLIIACAAWAATLSSAARQTTSREATSSAVNRQTGLAAWQQVYSVLTHPRCINCHTATNYPQQGDDRHRHLFNVVRGPAGKGVPALNCATCHQGSNADSTGVPGGPNWHLAPLSMKWQNRRDQILSSAAVCSAVTDRSRNENMDGPKLLRHHQEAPLVLWAWQPGLRRDGSARSLPPLSHEQFVAATRTWVEAGTPCPRTP